MRIILEFPISYSEIASVICPEQDDCPESYIEAITTDSRDTLKGDLFVALSGENDSGENYVEEARHKGAYIISAKSNYADFKVRDTSLALLKIAKFYKTKFKNLKKTVAITGSVGKTTAKNILSDLLSYKFKVHKTHENFNNFLGVAYTVFTMPTDTEILVCELGMNHAGEISELSKTLEPDISVITNIGNAHIGNLGSREDIAKAKLEIIDGMNEGYLILPHGEPLLQSANKKSTFSITDKKADCYIEAINENKNFTLVNIYTKDCKISSKKISIPGKHILFPIGMGTLLLCMLDFTPSEISLALDRLSSDCIRGNIKKIGKLSFYDDTYSSSPEATVADFELLSLYKDKKISCVLGDMLELGKESEKLHRYIGKKVFEYGFDKLFTFGKYASYIAQGAKDAGMPESAIYENPDVRSPEITARQINSACSDDEIILCKASHATRAYKIYDYIE